MMKKLKSARGASFIMALLAFLILALCGAGALTMAAANSGRYTHLETEQQAYLSLSSAVELVRSEFDKMHGTISFIHEQYHDTWTNSAGATETKDHFKLSGPTATIGTAPSAPAGALSSTMVEKLWNNGTPKGLGEICTAVCANMFDDSFFSGSPSNTPDGSYAKPALTVTDGNVFTSNFNMTVADDDKYGKVNVKLTVDPNLYIKMEFSYGDSNLYRAYMNIAPSGNVSLSEATQAAEKETQVVTDAGVEKIREKTTTEYLWDLRWAAQDATVEFVGTRS